MTLILDLPPELETQLQVAAARHGQDVKTFATAALAQASLDGPVVLYRADGTIQPSLAEFDAALDELEAIGAGIALGDERITHSREDIYGDHD